ncbi:MAG: hypothetical protein LBR08_10590 [Bacteroidales bacterium]|jgi:hypothetical protein|nr:hypothetical protein [Bacteroidales bacterium]
MKLKILLFAACSMATVLANAQDNAIDLAGTTWKLVAQNGEKTNPLTGQYKLYTQSHFFWYWVDNDGTVRNGAGGTYTCAGNICTEHVSVALPPVQHIRGKKNVITVTLSGNQMHQYGVMEGLAPFNELWEKVEEANSPKPERKKKNVL